MTDFTYWDNNGWIRTQARSISEIRRMIMRNKKRYTKPGRSWDICWGDKIGTLTYNGTSRIEWTWTTYSPRTAGSVGVHREPLSVYYVYPNGMLGNKLGKKYGF